MWKKYKFEWNFKRCEDNAGRQKTTQKKPRRRNKPKLPRVITGVQKIPPPNTRRIFCKYFGCPARTQATERILGKGGSPRYPRLRGQRRRAKDNAKKAETGNRTPDLPLTKRLLYQLSYLGMNNGKLIRYKYFTKNKELLHVFFFTVRVGADKTLIFSLSPAF